MTIQFPKFSSLHLFQYTPNFMVLELRDSTYQQPSRIAQNHQGNMLFIDNVQADTFRCMDCVTDPLEEIETLSDEIKDGNEIKLPELKRRLMEIAMLLSLPPHIFSQFHQLLEKGTYQYIPPDGVGQNYTAARFILPVREFATA